MPLVLLTLLTLALAPRVFAFSTDQSASKVIGQTDYTSSASGSTLSTLYDPLAAAFDASGDLWVVDTYNNRILEFVPPFSTGMTASLTIGVTSVGACPITAANTLCKPKSVAFDSSGDLWVADSVNTRVLEFTPPFSTGMSASLVIGQTDFTSSSYGASQSAFSLYGPVDLAFDSSGNLWVVDSGANRVLEFAPSFSNDMSASLVIGQTSFTGTGSSTTQSTFNTPFGLAFDASGDLWVSDGSNNRVLEFTPSFSTGMSASLVIGQYSYTNSFNGVTQNSLFNPERLAFDASGDLWVSDNSNNRVLEFAPSFSNDMSASLVIGQTGYTSRASGTTQSTLNYNQGIAIGPHGNLWVADSNNNRVLEYQGPAPVPDIPYGVLPLLVVIPALYYVFRRRQEPAQVHAGSVGHPADVVT